MAILSKLVFDSKKPKDNYLDVEVPEFGEGAKIRIQKMTVAGQIRLGRLHNTVREAKRISDDNRTALYSTATLMCAMVDEDGAYLEQNDDIETIKQVLVGLESHGVFMRLFTACNKVNGVVVDPEATKKNS